MPTVPDHSRSSPAPFRAFAVVRVSLAALLICSGCDRGGAGPRGGSGGARTLEQIRAEVELKEKEQRDRVRAGKPVPDFSLPTLDGRTFVLSQQRGKVVLINLWATWCVPCINEMQSLQRLYDKLRQRGLEVVAISVDSTSDRPAVEKFVAKNQLTFPVLLDPEMTVAELFGVSGYPETFFASADGTFAEILDIETEEPTSRVEGDRVWNSTEVLGAVTALLPASPPVTSDRSRKR